MANTTTGKTVGIHLSGPSQEGEWKEHHGTAFRCLVYFLPEEDGGFSVVAATLPGVASQGDTEKEALENITEALAAAISTYRADGVKIPWSEPPHDPKPGVVGRWVFVYV